MAAVPLPAYIQVEPVGRCNLRCQMCSIQFRKDNPPALMAFDTFTRIVDQLPDLKDLHLQGLGEPLLHSRFFDMVAYAVGKGVRVTINSNLTLLSLQRAELSVTSGLDRLYVSVDGATAETYERIRVGSRFVRLERNVHLLLEVRERLRSNHPQLATTMGTEQAPLRATMIVVGNPVGPLLLSLGAVIATSTVLLTEIWGLTRLSFAIARNKDLPSWLGQLSEPKRIPRNAVLTIGTLLMILTISVDLRPALAASSLALLIYYGIMNLSALRLPRDQHLYPLVVPAIGLIVNALMAFSLPRRTLLIVLGVLAVGLAYYVVHSKARK